MLLIVNGEEQTLDAATLAELLALLDYEGDCLATAVNGEFVSRQERHRRTLKAQDRIEILAPMQGG